MVFEGVCGGLVGVGRRAKKCLEVDGWILWRKEQKNVHTEHILRESYSL